MGCGFSSASGWRGKSLARREEAREVPIPVPWRLEKRSFAVMLLLAIWRLAAPVQACVNQLGAPTARWLRWEAACNGPARVDVTATGMQVLFILLFGAGLMWLLLKSRGDARSEE